MTRWSRWRPYWSNLWKGLRLFGLCFEELHKPVVSLGQSLVQDQWRKAAKTFEKPEETKALQEGLTFVQGLGAEGIPTQNCVAFWFYASLICKSLFRNGCVQVLRYLCIPCCTIVQGQVIAICRNGRKGPSKKATRERSRWKCLYNGIPKRLVE